MHPKEHYSVLKRNAVLTHAAARGPWRRGAKGNEPTQKDVLYDRADAAYLECQTQRQEVEWWLPGDMGQGAKGSCYLMSAVWGDNKALEVGGIMVAQQCECILLKMDKVINFMLHVFYHNKKYLVFLHRNSLWTLAHENRISSKECLNRAQNEMFGCTVISFLFTSKWFGKLTEDSGIFGGE